MSLLRPSRHLSTAPRCDRPVQGDGIMSFHCTLPQGHEAQNPDDPEPCYAVESNRSARAWDAWKRRQNAQEGQENSLIIACPECGDLALKVDLDAQTATCDGCGASVPFQQDPSEMTVVPDDPEQGGRDAPGMPDDVPEDWKGHPEVVSVDYDPEDTKASQPSRTRPEDQPLPDGDESQVDDQSLLIQDIEARRQVGISRYGQAHRPFNGRNTLQDLYEEQLDLLVYLRSIVRMAEADREELVEVVTQAIPPDLWNVGDVAEVAVDRLMGWVAAHRMTGLTEEDVMDGMDGLGGLSISYGQSIRPDLTSDEKAQAKVILNRALSVVMEESQQAGLLSPEWLDRTGRVPTDG